MSAEWFRFVCFRAGKHEFKVGVSATTDEVAVVRRVVESLMSFGLCTTSLKFFNDSANEADRTPLEPR